MSGSKSKSVPLEAKMIDILVLSGATSLILAPNQWMNSRQAFGLRADPSALRRLRGIQAVCSLFCIFGQPEAVVTTDVQSEGAILECTLDS